MRAKRLRRTEIFFDKQQSMLACRTTVPTWVWYSSTILDSARTSSRTVTSHCGYGQGALCQSRPLTQATSVLKASNVTSSYPAFCCPGPTEAT